MAIQPATLGGVLVRIVTPAKGVSPKQRARVLVNLHGGGFIGRNPGGAIESIPIAAMGGYKVVSIDYHLAPEHRFPAASEDVETVYRELLKTYRPENIGIYGSSAGGMLTAQATAWLRRNDLPPPGAIGMFGGAGVYWGEGDSGRFHAAQSGLPLSAVVDPRENPYLRDVDRNDALAYPGRCARTLAGFPPSLLISATRDLALSSVLQTHARLVAQGREAELHVWEGLGHVFYIEPDLPESREANEVVVRFFDRRLG